MPLTTSDDQAGVRVVQRLPHHRPYVGPVQLGVFVSDALPDLTQSVPNLTLSLLVHDCVEEVEREVLRQPLQPVEDVLLALAQGVVGGLDLSADRLVDRVAQPKRPRPEQGLNRLNAIHLMRPGTAFVVSLSLSLSLFSY